MLAVMWLTAALAMAPLPSFTERFLDADIAKSSTDFARSHTAPREACTGIGQVQCKRQFAVKQLQAIALLSEQSQLYAPLVNVWADPSLNDAESARVIFALGSPVVTRDYLAQQLARVTVLAAYARPYVRYLQASQAGFETVAESAEIAYWANTFTAIEQYLQSKAPEGAVVNMEQLFLTRIKGLTVANCAYRFGEDAKEPAFGNDLFSKARSMLVQRARSACVERVQAEALNALTSFFERFNRELAGRYPFDDMATTAPAASDDTIRRFMVDYLAQRSELLRYASRLPQAHRADANRLFERLDKALTERISLPTGHPLSP